MEVLAKIAGNNAPIGGIISEPTKALIIATRAYGVHAIPKPAIRNNTSDQYY